MEIKMTETTNYKFQKPGLDGAANIEVLDANWDKADGVIKAEADARAAADAEQQDSIDALVQADAERPTKSEVLTKTNTTAYTPSANYHPATKKYVDDKAANIPVSAISGTLPVSKGGTGSATAAGALANLGIKIQTTVPSSLNNGEIVFVVEV